MHTLTFFFSFLLCPETVEASFITSKYLNPILAGLLHLGQTNIVFDKSIGAGNSILWPFSPCFLGRICLISKFRPSILALFRDGKICKTFPVLPLSLPAIIFTLSPFFIFILCLAVALRGEGGYTFKALPALNSQS